MKHILWLVAILAVFAAIAAGAITVNAAPNGNITLSAGQTLTVKPNGCNLKVKTNTSALVVVVCKATAKAVPNSSFAPTGKVTLNAGQKQKVLANGCNLSVTKNTVSLVKVKCAGTGGATATPTHTRTPSRTATFTATPTPTSTSSATQEPGTTIHISEAWDDYENGSSYGGVMSQDGRYIAFASDADNMVVLDTNNWEDVFVWDTQTQEMTMASVSSSGEQGDYGGWNPSISADGRYVAFETWSAYSYYDQNFGNTDIYVHDMQTGETKLVSVTAEGMAGENDSDSAAISADGKFVAFESRAHDLVSEDTNQRYDVFVYDVDGETVTRVSVDSDGEEGNYASILPSLSGDGRYVVFRSWASNLVSGDTMNTCDVNLDGVFTDNCPDIFVHDMQTGETTRVSVASDGTQGNGGYNDNGNYGTPVISEDGRYVAFDSKANNLVPGDTNICSNFPCADVFVHDRQTGTTTRVSVASDGTQGNGNSTVGCISPDGRYVAFMSNATNLVSGATNTYKGAFLHDMQTGKTVRVSVSNTGAIGNNNSYVGGTCVSPDGQSVVFDSDATNLTDDYNSVEDVFLRERQ